MSERPVVRHSTIWKPENIEDIQAKADLGRYRIRGFSALRDRPLPSFDDLTFVPCTLTRVPLEGYREKCSTQTVLGTRFAKKPIEIDIPIMVTGMSYGALSYNAKVALAKAAARAGTSTTTGDGGMLAAEREHSDILIYEVLPSRYGIDVHHLRQADAIELTVGQGAKPGTGGLLLESKVSDEIAELRDLPPGVDQRSPCRHPDWLGPDDMLTKDRGAARGNRLAGSDFCQNGRGPRVRRCEAGGQGGSRRGCGRWDGGRHGRLAGYPA